MTSVSRRLLSAIACLGIMLSTIVIFSTPSYAADCDAEERTEALGQTPWPLERLKPERVWPLTRGQGITVAVVDSGVGEHPILKGKVTAYDMTDSNRGARCDMASHGTLVAGIIAGHDTDSSPFHGIAPGVKILSYKVLEDVESSSSKDSVIPVVNGIRQAINDGADVINLSLTAVHTQALQDVINDAFDAGIVVVAAAGNQGGKGGIAYPAAYDHVIAVGGITQDGAHVESSSTGDYLDIAAPGKEIDGPAPSGGGYGRRSEGGTSFAAPYVSAAAALVKSYYPHLNPDQVSHRLTATADHPPEGWNSTVGYGELNIYRALTTVLPGEPQPDEELTAVTAPVSAIDTGVEIRQNAMKWTFWALLFVVVALLGKLIVPRGRARRWRGRSLAGPSAAGGALLAG